MTTEILLVAFIVILLLWEGWTLINKRRADTISETTWRATMRRPFIVFLIGFLFGHLFWQSDTTYDVLDAAQFEGCPRGPYEIKVICISPTPVTLHEREKVLDVDED